MKNENTKHTPGPWEVSKIRNTDVELGGRYYLQYRQWDNNDTTETVEPGANALLIAACPIMFDFIKDQADKGNAQAQAIIKTLA